MPRPSGLTLECLRTFQAFVECELDTKTAAARLKINQSSLSKRLGFLKSTQTRENAGLIRPWLRRRGKRWDVTSEGLKALDAVKQLVSGYEILCAGIEEPPRLRLSIGCGQHGFGRYLLLPVAKFRRRFPDTAVEVKIVRGERRISGVANGSLDAALVSHSSREIDALAKLKTPLQKLILPADPLMLVRLREEKLVKYGKYWRDLPATITSAKQLIGLPLVLPDASSGMRKNIDPHLKVVAEQLTIELEIGGWSNILECVSHGLGIGVVCKSSLPPDTEGRFVTKTLSARVCPAQTSRLITRSLSEESPSPTPPLAEFLAIFKKENKLK